MKFLVHKKAFRVSGSSSPLEGERHSSKLTVVNLVESWGVKKLASNSGDITFPRREGDVTALSCELLLMVLEKIKHSF